MTTRSILFVVFVSIFVATSRASVQSLYTDKDHVLELDIDNFNTSVYNQPRAFFVEFYASWCGHCIHYKPTWVQFATQLRHWTKVVQVTVVNCADEKNSPLCREHAIAAFPTVKYFKVNSESKDDGKMYEGDKYNLPEMTKSLVGHIKADYDSAHPSNWPKLEVTPESETVDTLWKQAPSDAAVLSLVIDDEPYSDGLAVVINYQNNPLVHVALLGVKHPLAKQFGGVAVPSVHVFKRTQPNEPVFSSAASEGAAQIITRIENVLHDLGADVSKPHETANAAANDQIASPVVVDWKQYEVQYLDITSALHYMITQEIPRRPVIDGHHLRILKDIVHVLRKFLPLSAPVRRLFYRLDDNLQPITTKITAEEWLLIFERLQSELGHPLPSKTDFKACRGSKPYLRGYTCGLWTLFHAVTVQAYKDNQHNPDFKPADEVLEPIHQFVFNYLSCAICAKNFDRMAREHGLLDTKQPEDAVLWLWRGHNRANKRLAGDASEDPKFPKQQFPPASLCPKCHKPDGEFDEAEVLKFLVAYYGNIKVDGVKPEPGYQVKEFDKGKLEKVSNKHLNPKFAGMAGKVDRLEEAERRRSQIDVEQIEAQTADRSTFYFLWFVIVALFVFAYFKYRQNRSKFWKTIYYHDYKFLPWSMNAASNLSKYVV